MDPLEMFSLHKKALLRKSRLTGVESDGLPLLLQFRRALVRRYISATAMRMLEADWRGSIGLNDVVGVVGRYVRWHPVKSKVR